MRKKNYLTVFILMVFCLFVNFSFAAIDNTKPSIPVKLIFIHHSTGGNWLADSNTEQPYGGLGTALKNNNYYVSATNYGWGPDSIGDSTDIPDWPRWFTGTNSAAVLSALFSETGQNIGGFGSWSRLATAPAGQNTIIMFKSCFPNSDLFGSPTDSAGATPDSSYTVSNAKAVYNNLLTYFTTRTDKLFIVITAPPQNKSDYTTDYQTADQRSANARAFNNWLVNNWLSGYPHSNVAVFDYYNVLTGTGNHHRWFFNAVQHVTGVNYNYSAYPADTYDSHPSSAGHQKATTEFVDLLNYYYNKWQASLVGTSFYQDSDSDGFGNPSIFVNSSSAPFGYVSNNKDCNDANADIHPNAIDIPNDSIDQDCNGFDTKFAMYYPHIASNSKWETEIGLVNTSAVSSLNGAVKAYNNTGSLVASTPVTLVSNARKSIIIGNEFTSNDQIGYIVFESDASHVKGYSKFYIDGQFRVAIPAVLEVNTSDIYISHIASNNDWWTGVSLLNTTAAAKTISMEFSNGATVNRTIAAGEHQVFTIKSLFAGVSQPLIKSAVIKNTSGIIGLELFSSSDASSDKYLSGVLLKDDSTTTIYYPHIASNDKWWTGVVAYNTSSLANALTITPFKADGTQLTASVMNLGAKEKYKGTAASLNFPQDSAWFRIVASSPITGLELFGTKDGNQLGGYTGVNISSSAGIFAKIETNGWTGIAFVNIDDASANVTMNAYNDDGETIATQAIVLSAHEKRVGVASSFFTQNIDNATYIGYSSTTDIVGFQLNGSTGGMMLDSLPGM